MTSIKKPIKGKSREAKKPIKAELDGIRSRSKARYGTAKSEATVLATWQRNQERAAAKKIKAVKEKKGGSARLNPNGPGKVAGPKKRGAASSITSEAASPSKRGNPRINGLPGRSALAPGRKRGNPTPGANPVTPGPVKAGPRAARPSTKMKPKTALKPVGRVMPGGVKAGPQLGYDEKNPIRVSLPSGERLPRRRAPATR